MDLEILEGDNSTSCGGNTCHKTECVNLCTSFRDGYGLRAYENYCLENFASVDYAYSGRYFRKAYGEFASYTQSLAENRQDLSRKERLLRTHQAFDALPTESFGTDCLAGCSEFVAEYCCQEILEETCEIEVFLSYEYIEDEDGESVTLQLKYTLAISPESTTESAYIESGGGGYSPRPSEVLGFQFIVQETLLKRETSDVYTEIVPLSGVVRPALEITIGFNATSANGEACVATRKDTIPNPFAPPTRAPTVPAPLTRGPTVPPTRAPTVPPTRAPPVSTLSPSG